jgi:membrane-bound metal-dependent hydrolase YbcI (DUF457 family)
MPTPVGHSLAGIAVALVGERGRVPRDFHRFLARPMTLACVALATLPDADLLLPGIHRTATHSLTATVVVALVAVAVTARATSRRSRTGGARSSIAWSAVVMCAAAHGSHILLDWLGQDPSKVPGVQALWPLSDRWFISGWDIFPAEERRHIFSLPTMVHNMNVLGWELGILGPIVIGLWWLGHKARRTTEVAAPTE